MDDERVSIARLEQRVSALGESFDHLRDEVKYPSRGVVHRLAGSSSPWGLGLVGKDVGTALT